jgi:Spx/MgsR family transcriptional regulator
LEVEFIDLKKTTPPSSTIQHWIEQTNIDTVLNSKGTIYKSLKLKDLNLDENGKFEWLCKEPMLLKRPIIESSTQVVVGFDEEKYTNSFVK